LEVVATAAGALDSLLTLFGKFQHLFSVTLPVLACAFLNPAFLLKACEMVFVAMFRTSVMIFGRIASKSLIWMKEEFNLVLVLQVRSIPVSQRERK
jgi:hypothetical protein